MEQKKYVVIFSSRRRQRQLEEGGRGQTQGVVRRSRASHPQVPGGEHQRPAEGGRNEVLTGPSLFS